jgi:DNA helicase HerA-like ATPase
VLVAVRVVQWRTDVLLDEVLGDDIDEREGISLGALGSGDEGLVRCGGSGDKLAFHMGN